MKKISIKHTGSAILMVLLSAGILSACNNSSDGGDKKDSGTTMQSTDTSKKMAPDTSHKMMQDTGHKSDQVPPPK